MSIEIEPIEVKYLHNAVKREICGGIYNFTIIIDMKNKHYLNELFVVLDKSIYIVYPDLTWIAGDMVMTKRGVLIENIAGNRTSLTMTDIDNIQCCYPNG